MLHHNAMLVYLSIKQPKQERVDKRITEDLLTAHGSARDSAKVVKVLFDPASYKPIKKLINEIRSYHYSRTLPWLDGGQRILSSAGFMTYTEQMREYRAQLMTLVDEFVSTYQDQLNAAKLRLNGMFKQEDYPDPTTVRERFSLDLSYCPVPTSGDFRVEGIDSAEKALIQAQLDERQNAATQQAMAEAYSRLREAVKHMADKLKDPKAIFRDSLVDNLQELVDVLPSLNLTGDPRLEELRQEVDAQLAGCDPKDLRQNEDFRKEVATDAQAIVDKMAGFMGV